MSDKERTTTMEKAMTFSTEDIELKQSKEETGGNA
jgi:hypothetical protein